MTNENQKKLPEIIVWKSLSRGQTERSVAWYLVLGVIGLGLIIFGIYSRSIIMVITFVVLILSVMVLAGQKPKMITYKATKTGLVAGDTTYPYKIIKIFWILYDPPQVKTLYFETSAYLNSRISLELGDQNPLELKLFLKQYLPEDLDREENFTETLARHLKI